MIDPANRIRLFQSPLLERLTLTTPMPVALLWCAIILLLLAWAATSPLWDPSWGLVWMGVGLFIWTPFEYVMHRVVFHWPATSPQGKHAVYVMHGGHHIQPQDRMRGLMPPFASLPLALALYGLTAMMLDQPWSQAAFAGFLIGYLIFDMIHWACHHRHPRTALGRAIRRYHHIHHHSTRPGNYGVSTPLWDWVFGTLVRKSGDTSGV